MKREIPRDPDGRRLCEYCMEQPVPESLGTKPRRYCSRSCVQRAYEARQTLKTIAAAVDMAVERDRKSREIPGTSRDFPKSEVTAEVPARVERKPPLPPLPPLPPARRQTGRRGSTRTASAMPLPFELPDDQEQPDA